MKQIYYLPPEIVNQLHVIIDIYHKNEQRVKRKNFDKSSWTADLISTYIKSLYVALKIIRASSIHSFRQCISITA